MNKHLILAYFLTSAQVAMAQNCNDYIPASTPDSRFSVEGTEVFDKITGLTWQRCSLGQSGIDCSGGNAIGYDWQSALLAAEEARNNTGVNWRLPNIKELVSIVEWKCSPAINLTIFPNTPSETYWSAWSASTYARDSTKAWTSGYGTARTDKDSLNSVRLVRGPE